ncbi:DNA mismatch repair protein Msh3 isoform X3 [Petromyzon marinus]|uniref:DNA mismatch repair protein Msh3 isoform X3 n=1 Tax=Petromyzon marinus TaxID=7757 RepID=UPI003F6FFC42
MPRNRSKRAKASATPRAKQQQQQQGISHYFTRAASGASASQHARAERHAEAAAVELTAKRKTKTEKNGVKEIVPPAKKPKRTCEALEDADAFASSSDDHEETRDTPAEKNLAPSTAERLRGFSSEALEEVTTRASSRKAGSHKSREALDTRSTCTTSDINHNSTADEKSRSTSAFLRRFLSNSGHSERPKAVDSTLNKRTKTIYTPLEQQYLDIKEQHGGTLLLVECGYKHRFFGEDAEIAAKELNITCHQDHNFMTASIPTHRLFIHVRRLVAKGYKVGVVKQTETTALKAAGENKSALFSRKLTALYTKSTLIGEDVDPLDRLGEEPEEDEDQTSSPSSYLLCLSEVPSGSSTRQGGQNVTFGLVAVQPSTGELLFDCFEDGKARLELESRVLSLQPVELLIPAALSDETERSLCSLTANSSQGDDRVRVERVDVDLFEHSRAFQAVSRFFGAESLQSNCNHDEQKLSHVLAMEKPIIACLAVLIHYLTEFGLERVLYLSSNFQKFSMESECLHINGITQKNMELFQNQTNGKVKGSLLWAMDRTCTPFGRRMFRNWLGRPLISISDINARLDCVSEILASEHMVLSRAKELLWKLPDLERGLTSIYHRKCSTKEFSLIASSLERLCTETHALAASAQDQLSSPLLLGILLDVPRRLQHVQHYTRVLDKQAAKEGDKTRLFTDLTGFPRMLRRSEEIRAVLEELREHRTEVRRTLRSPAADYTTVSGQEYEGGDSVPYAFCGAEVQAALPAPGETANRQQRRVAGFPHFGEHYHNFRAAVAQLATLDCLFSLAAIASRDGYCRPEFVEEKSLIVIENGRHPVVELLMGDQNQYVPNSTHLDADGKRAMIITGPNMGGKSSYIRQVALIAVMAQMGSFVPASHAKLSSLHAIHTRMGASDNIYKGHSTFMEELSEASEIIRKATRHSLVILDELGRGTSTHDGIAIAYATLEYFVKEVQCLTLFVTHYPPVCEMERLNAEVVSNYHMSFLLSEPEETAQGEDGERLESVTFLYQLTEGPAARSYGLNVARLAAIPEQVLHTAAQKSRELEAHINMKRKNISHFLRVWDLEEYEASNQLQTLFS